MKTLKLTLLSFTALLFAANVNAQSQKTGVCYTDEHFNEEAAKDPSLLQQRQDLENYIANFKQSYDPSTQRQATIIIPVVVHNITWVNALGFEQGKVSKATVDAQINRLNDDFNRLNSDASSTRAQFLPHVSATDVEFRLAHIDPNGNCTEGITRNQSPLSNSTSTGMADGVKNIVNWPTSGPRAYFNIWVIDNIQNNGGSFIAGFAQFPGNNNNGGYGVVMDKTVFSGSARTLTHEVGHCLQLFHTFQGGCSSSGNNGGDGCADTPPSNTNGFNCGGTINSCSNIPSNDPYGINELDQTENYMSYASCQNMFSLDQKTRMMAILTNTNTNSGVGHLALSSNLTATGTATPYGPVVCAPIADFTFNKEFICEGASVTYSDNSYNATPTSWNWTFAGGSPATSSASNPVITYSTAGVYSSTLVSITAAGNSAPVTKTSIITVSSMNAQYTGPIVDGFENTTAFGNDWRIVNGGGQTWQNNTSASTTGSRSVRIRNFFNSTDGQVSELISPAFDISTTTTKTMTFKQAFAKKGSADNDKLLVFYSTNCGATWQLKLPLTVSVLKTAPDQSSAFTPGSGDWIQRSVSLSSIGTSTNVRFKFQFTSGGGNDIYIDDINIGGVSVGIEDFSNIGSFSVYPNPTNSSAQISFNLIEDVKNLSIKVRNAVGQEVTNVVDGQSFNTGKYTLKIDEGRKLSSGIYFIEFNADNNIKVQKLIVQ